MPDDVRQALERFQRFIESHPSGTVIDDLSGFSVEDGMLLVGEIKMSGVHQGPDESPID